MDWIRIPLPAIIYNKDRGLEFFSTGKFDAGHHDNGHYGYKDYVLYEGNIHRITCDAFQASDKYEVQGFDTAEATNEEGKSIEKRFAIIGGKGYLMEQKTIWDLGLLGGGTTSFYDLSPTKNVVTMFIVALLLFLAFRMTAKAYERRDGQAPTGLQSLLEPMVVFIREEVAIPFLKHKHKKYLPLLLTIFFFILGLNLWGQVPFLGSVNVSGSLTVTMIMAIIVFIITNINGNKHYWGHIFNFPGVPWFVKLILTPVEVLGLFIKPLTLMLRLAGNISAGHIAILSFVGLIFIFGKSGQNFSGSLIGTGLAIPLTLFMMAIELIVAFIQAYVFTILTASYIGAAVEDHDDHH
jgi:F-type H+-transporting ATPase subunit a